jgi:putative tricarboxylic transport membrane protein
MRLRKILCAGVVACAAVAASSAFAQSTWRPERNVEVIVGTSAGGAADHTARMLQKLLHAAKVNSVTVNKPGASYAASFIYLNQHPGDGHYVAISPINLLTNRILGLAPTGHADITPLAQLISDYHVFSVLADSPLKSGADLIAALKKDAASLSIAISPSFGSANHFAAGTIFKAAGVDIKRLKIVAFASGGESTTAVLGGHADVLVSATPAVTPMIEAGKMRAIAMSGEKRIGGAFSKVPTWKEQGVNATFSNWRGLIGPKDMTPAQIAFWDETLERIARSPEWRSDLERNNQDAAYMNSRDSKRFLDEQSRDLAVLLTDLGLTKGAAK